MKAVVLRKHGTGGLRYETDFAHLAPGLGVVWVRAASLNDDDIFTRRGMPGIKIPVSAIMGLDIAGAIAATDREVLDRKLAAHVLGDPINRVEDGHTGETVHGGPIAAIIDTIGDYVMLLARPQPTVNFRVDYLRPEVDTARIITSTVRRRSGRLIGWWVSMWRTRWASCCP
jgi:NADPH:quinone reductase-like Zn-dependent oxidoreductase